MGMALDYLGGPKCNLKGLQNREPEGHLMQQMACGD